MSISCIEGVFLTNNPTTIDEAEFDTAFSKIRLERPYFMNSDIKGVKRCDIGNHDTGLYTTVRINEPFSDKETNICQDLHHAAVFINPENPRAAANKKL
jgi:hypothetical protein